MAERYDASLDGFSLDIETIEDGFEKAVAVYEIPYRDGALTDDLGRKARSIKFRAYFFEATYDRHFDFLAHLDSKELFELVHPKYGLIKGRIRSASVRHDDRIETAEIDIEFIEHLKGATEPARRTDVKNEAQALYEQGWKDLLNKPLPEVKNRSLASYVDAYVAKIETRLTEITNPANSIIAGIEFGESLPGRVVGAIARVAERYSLLYSSLRTMPEKFIVNLRDALYGLGNELGYPDHARAGASLQAGYDLAGIFSEDEDERDVARVLETTQSFDARGNYIKAESTPDLLTANEIETSLALVNAMIQDAVSTDRTLQSLKDMVRVLTEHAVNIKIESEKLVKVYIDQETPLHLICLQRDLPYNYAERILKVNDIPNPNAVKGEIQVYVR